MMLTAVSQYVVGMILDHSSITLTQVWKTTLLASVKRLVSYSSRAKARTTCTPTTFSCNRLDTSPTALSTAKNSPPTFVPKTEVININGIMGKSAITARVEFADSII